MTGSLWCGYPTMMREPPDSAAGVSGAGRHPPRPRVLLRPPHLRRHHGLMAVTYAVVAGTEDEVRTALQQLVDVFGLEWLMPPQQLPGQDKWLGRVTTPVAPAAVRTLPAVAS